MKHDQFIVALHEDIKEKVDDKEPEYFERAKEVAISKWRKRMRKLGRDMKEDDGAIEGATSYVHKVHEKSHDVSSPRESSTSGAMDLAQQVAKMAYEVSKICINQGELTRSMQISQKKKDIGRQNPKV